MNRFLTWLRQTFSSSSPKSAVVMREARARINPGRPGNPPAVRQPKKQPASAEVTVDSAATESVTGHSGKIGDGGPGKNILARSRYVWEETGTQDTLKILDDSLSQADEEDGIDPYNTGQFDRSKSWDGLSRK